MAHDTTHTERSAIHSKPGADGTRLHILSPYETPLADTSTEVSSPLAKALAELTGIHLTDKAEEADALILVEPFSFKEWRHIKALKACPVLSRNAHRTYSVNFDDSASGLLRGAYAGLRRPRFNPAIHRAVPYHRYPNTLITAPHATIVPDLLATYRGNPKSNPLRHKLLKRYEGHPRIHVESTASWMNHGSSEQQHYVDLLLRGKFALCPAGWAPVSFRIYEAMALGRCPVLLADDFMRPGFMDWDSFSLTVPQRSLADLPVLLEKEESRAASLGACARRVWEEHCSPSTVWTHIARSLVDCIHAAPPTSQEAEVARWESLSMAWQNEWTIPQRIANKLRRLAARSRG